MTHAPTLSESFSPAELTMQRKFFEQFLAAVQGTLDGIPAANHPDERTGVLATVHYNTSTALQNNTDAALESAQGAQIKREIACKKGCAFCCYQRVAITIIEAIAIGSWIAQLRPQIGAHVLSQAARYAGFDDDKSRAASRLPCVFLDRAGACSIHEFRPLVCRAHFSLNLKACNDAYGRGVPTGEHGEIISFAFPEVFRGAIAAAINAASAEKGLQSCHVELTAAVALVLADPGAADRWLAGEPVFTPYTV